MTPDQGVPSPTNDNLTLYDKIPSWEQPFCGTDISILELYNGKCGNTALSNMIYTVGGQEMPPDDPRVEDVLKEQINTPGVRPGTMENGLNELLSKDKSGRDLVWDTRSALLDATFNQKQRAQNVVSQFKSLPFTALIGWDSNPLALHWVSINDLELDAAGNIETVHYSTWGIHVKQDFDSFVDWWADTGLGPDYTAIGIVDADPAFAPPAQIPEPGPSPTPSPTPTPSPSWSPTPTPSPTPGPSPTPSSGY